MADIGAKISIDGAKQFRDDLKNITQQGKTLSAQMNTLATSFDKADNKEDLLAKASKNLDAQIQNQQKLVDKLTDAVAKSAAEKGEDATQTLKLKEQLAKAETGLNKLKDTTAESALGINELAESEEKAGQEAKEANNQTSAWTIALGNLLSDAIKAGFNFMVDSLKSVVNYFKEAVTGASEYADEIVTLSKTTGLSTQALQEYTYMAKLVDVDLSTITGSITKLEKSMASASTGSGAAADTFASLGISVMDADGNFRSANDVFLDAIDALGKIDNDVERDTVAMTLFGKSAKDLNPLIEQGSDGLNAFREEANKVGAVLGDDTLEKLTEVQDGFDRLGLTADAVKNQIGASIGEYMLPYLNELVAAFQDLASTHDVGAFAESISLIINHLLDDLVAALPSILDAGSRIVQNLVRGIVSQIPAIGRSALTLISELVKYLLTDGLPAILDTAIQLTVELARGLGEQAETLIPAAIQCVIQLAYGLMSNVGLIIDAALSLIDGIVRGLTSDEGILSLIDAIPTLYAALVQGILDNLDTIISSAINIIIALGLGMIRAIPKLVKMIPQIIVAVYNAITEYDWVGLGKEIIDGIDDGLLQKASDIWNTVTEAFNSAVEWLKGLGSQALSWGRDMIQGFINGIKQKVQNLLNEVQNIGRAIADFLGFSVPKKGVLHYYESWMPDFMMGLAKGIDDNAWRVQDALKDATGGMTLSGRTTNVEMGGIAVNVYASPNQDANAIARQVMAVMQNEYNAKKAVFA